MPNQLRVVIVDDDEKLTVALTAMLHQAGATVVASARTYKSGLTLLDAGRRCDAAFVELRLGGQAAGIDLVRRAARAGLTVVVMTGGDSLPDGLAGAGLLLKPFSSAQVGTILHTLSGSRLTPHS